MPTYKSLGDHSETIQIDFDPDRLSYEDLLQRFWKSHDPHHRSWSRQYMTAIFFHDEAQKRVAIKTRDRLATESGRRIYTQILPASEFYQAEAYHQKHALRGDRQLMILFGSVFETNDAVMNSTAAARVNGYLGGYGDLGSLAKELFDLDLPSTAAKKVLEMLRRYGR